MSKKILNSNLKKTNFFDGQRVSESDLDSNQKYFEDLIASGNIDFHSSGVLKKSLMPKILLDTSKPGHYSPDGSENSFSGLINARTFDGISIKTDIQPSDREFGVRLEVELFNSEARGREQQVKVLIVGVSYDPIHPSGIANYEVLIFDDNKALLTENHYTEVSCIIINDMSRGSGLTDSGVGKVSKNFGGDIIIREADSAKIFAKSNAIKNVYSPNFDLESMYGEVSLRNQINLGLFPTSSYEELFISYDKESFSFEVDAPIGISFGQKFVSSSNNIQKFEILMSVDRSSQNNLDWQGDLVFSVYELEDASASRSANPLDGNPKISPIVEVSLDQEDLEARGYSLKENFSKIEIDFSSSKISDPNSGAIERGKAYAFVVSRSGSNTYGKVNVAAGKNYLLAKRESGLKISIKDAYDPVLYEFLEFDPNYSAYISDEEKSLWFVVHSDQIEITSGIIYGANGKVFSIPRLEGYISETKVNFKMPPIDLVSNNKKNIVGVSSSNKFTNPDVHPRTGNFVYTRIEDYPQVSVFLDEDQTVDKDDFVLLGSVTDSSSRTSDVIKIQNNKVGILNRDFIYILNPTNEILSQNMVGKKISIDPNFSKEYIVNKSELKTYKYGDFDGNGRFTSSDITRVVELSGNSLTSTETQRSILGGAIDFLDYLRADLNGDDIIGGEDVELIEQALDGRVAFPVGENLTVLKLSFESEVISESSQEILSAVSIPSGQGDSEIVISTTREKALLLAIGDEVYFSSGANEGTYYISSKEIASDGTTVTIGLSDEEDTTALLFAEASNSLVIYSKNITNCLLDNVNLLKTPFSSTEVLLFGNEYFQERNIKICDLRSFLDFSFQEYESNSCQCSSEIHTCDLKKINNKYLPGDLYVEGRIKDSKGNEFSSDYEFANVSVDLPVGTLNGCQIDLYNSFIKGEGNGCLTETGYPAMRFSDGTYVGCEDSGEDTDLAKDRVKITGAIASLHVDAFVDGYEVDGSSDITETFLSKDKITESSKNFVYTEFNKASPLLWPQNNFGSNFTFTQSSNGQADIRLTTHLSSSTTTAYIENPSEISSIPGVEGDFIYDFEVSRDTILWKDSQLLSGRVEFYLEFEINNGGLEKSLLRIGYRVSSGTTKVFYSGKVYDSAGAEIYSFDFEDDAPEAVGERIFFRLRRVNDAVYGYYINPSLYDPDTNPSQEFVRIGQNLLVQPGSGFGLSKFVMSNGAGSTTGLDFQVMLHKADIQCEASQANASGNITISKNYSTEETSKLLLSLPLPYSSTVKITSAKLKMIAAGSSSPGILDITPIANLNLKNLGLFYNLSKTDSTISIVKETIGSIASGDQIEIEILDLIKHFQTNSGHLSGQNKGILLEFDPSNLVSSSSLTVDDDIQIEYTYEDYTTGVVFQIGVDVDPRTGLATFKTKNILYDYGDKSKRTRINFGVHLKKSGFKNKDIEVTTTDLQRVKYGIGSCIDEDALKTEEIADCYFVVGSTDGSTFVQGPFPCNFVANGSQYSSSSIEEIVVTQSAGKFFFDGFESPTLNLTEGAIYVFDVSNASMTGIELAFKLDGGTQIVDDYTESGTAGSATAEVIFKIPPASVNIIYYDKSGTISDTGILSS